MKYHIYARLFPALLVSVPYILFYFFTLGTKIGEFLSYTMSLEVIADVTISMAVIYALIQINRWLSKEIFQKRYFKDEIYMPTTNYLLWGNNIIPDDIKIMIRRKIKDNFNIDLLVPDEEKRDDERARKLIIFAVSQIRNRLRDNSIVLRHNIEYGFIRNFLGGCILAVIISIANILIFKYYQFHEVAFEVSCLLLIIYLLPILLSKLILSKFGHYYAKILFEQYMST